MLWKSFFAALATFTSWRVQLVVAICTLIFVGVGRYTKRLLGEENGESVSVKREFSQTFAFYCLALLIRFYLLTFLLVALAPFLIDRRGLDFKGAIEQALPMFYPTIGAFIVWMSLILVPIIGSILWNSPHVQHFLVGVSAIVYVFGRNGMRLKYTEDQLTSVVVGLCILGVVTILISIAMLKGAQYILAFVLAVISPPKLGRDATGRLGYVNKPSSVLSATVLFFATWSQLLPVIWLFYYLVGQSR